MAKNIILSNGQRAIVDDCDFDELSRYKWYCDTLGYARRSTPRKDGKQKTIRMHRQILNAQSGEEVDHANGNRLDNRRSNIRICTRGQNMHNRRAYKNNLSGYKNVFKAPNGKWYARLKINGKYLHLGVFKTPELAAKEHDKMAIKHYGEFAHLNFP